MDTYPDPLMKNIIIPVVHRKGNFKLLDGREMPKIKEDAIGSLELNERDVLDLDLICELQAKSNVLMLPKGKHVYFEVSLNMIPDNLKGQLLNTKRFDIVNNYRYVEVVLDEPLMLHLRGSKTPQLLDCQCTIPSLENLKADSLNHTYTLISRHFEKKRRSHSGNVFQKGHYLDGEKWMTLDKIRDQCQEK